jgi:hypothetical protein
LLARELLPGDHLAAFSERNQVKGVLAEIDAD